MRRDYDLFQVIRNQSFSDFKNHFSIEMLGETSTDKQSLLHHAIAYGKIDIAWFLLEQGIDVNLQDADGFSPLHYIGEHKNTALAQALINHGANVNVRDNYGNTPLWTAAFNAQREYDLVRLLLEHGADPTLKNNVEKSVLDLARERHEQELLAILAKYA